MSFEALAAALLVCSQWVDLLRTDGLVWSSVFFRTFGGEVSPLLALATCQRCLRALRGLSLVPVLDSATRLPLEITPRAGAAAVVLGNDVVITGGSGEDFRMRSDADLIDRQRIGGLRSDLADSSEDARLGLGIQPRGDPLPRRWLHTVTPVGRCAAVLYGGDGHLGGWGAVHLLTNDASTSGSPALSGHNSNHLLSLRLGVENEASGPGTLVGHTAARAPAALPVADAAWACVLVFGGRQAATVRNGLWALRVLRRSPTAAQIEAQLPAASGARESIDVFNHAVDERQRRGEAEWMCVHTTGAPPSPRWCHSATLAAAEAAEAEAAVAEVATVAAAAAAAAETASSSAREAAAPAAPAAPAAWWVFGGWGAARASAFLNDVHRLELREMRWEAPAVRGAVPRARCQAPCAASADGALLLVFGGACHSEVPPAVASDQPYGDKVVDLADACLLHLPTATWLPCAATYAPLRGGTNALVHTGERLLLCGGMNSDAGSDSPNFLSATAEVVGFDSRS